MSYKCAERAGNRDTFPLRRFSMQIQKKLTQNFNVKTKRLKKKLSSLSKCLYKLNYIFN